MHFKGLVGHLTQIYVNLGVSGANEEILLLLMGVGSFDGGQIKYMKQRCSNIHKKDNNLFENVKKQLKNNSILRVWHSSSFDEPCELKLLSAK